MTRVVEHDFLAVFGVLTDPREGIEDVLARRLTKYTVLVVSEKDDVLRAIAFNLRQVGVEIACIATRLTKLAFLVEVVDTDNDSTGFLLRCSSERRRLGVG